MYKISKNRLFQYCNKEDIAISHYNDLHNAASTPKKLNTVITWQKI